LPFTYDNEYVYACAKNSRRICDETLSVHYRNLLFQVSNVLLSAVSQKSQHSDGSRLFEIYRYRFHSVNKTIQHWWRWCCNFNMPCVGCEDSYLCSSWN